MKYSNKIQECIFKSNIKIIFAIDIKKGKVVKAFAGLRFNYKLLSLDNFDYSNPIRLIEIASTKLNLENIYIADLDSIQNLQPNSKIIIDILKKFPKINFYIDSGLSYPISIFNQQRLFLKNQLENFKIILGTESLRFFRLQDLKRNHNCLISIDFNGKQNIWLIKLSKINLQFDLIFMFLKKIGGRGVDWKKSKELVKLFPNKNCFFAGGVRNFSDIHRLKKIGFSGVILSTIIHDKIRDGF